MLIYLITNLINNKKYVGQTTKTIKERFRRHCWVSESKKNMPISCAIKKYGKENFIIEVIAECRFQDVADILEIYFVLELDTFCPRGYNLRAGNARGVCSLDTRIKISEANKGRFVSEKTKKKLSESHLGNKCSQETKDKLSAHFKNRPLKPEHVKKIKDSQPKNIYEIESPIGEIHIVDNMRQFCSVHNLSAPKMSCVANGKCSHHKQWKCKFLEKNRKC